MDKKRLLISFVGLQDPYNNTGKEGPILTLLKKEAFDSVLLLCTLDEAIKSNADSTVNKIKALKLVSEVNAFQLDIKDPTDHIEVFNKIKSFIQHNTNYLSSNNVYVSLTSGTPQMHIAMFLLVASRELTATMLYLPDPTKALANVKTIIPWQPDMPDILPRIPKGHIDLVSDKDLEAVKKECGIIGNSPNFTVTIKKAIKYSKYDYAVIIVGETGTGKELIARLIHKVSNRKDKPFVSFNCAAITETIAESELFGYKKGAFTGATSDKKGLFKEADKGTLFLDEVGELGPSIQAKLLRAVETGEIIPVGATETERVDVRIVTATHRDLERMVSEGKFREDLYYRLNVLKLNLKPLRDRRQDIPALAKSFLEEFCSTNDIKKQFTERAFQKLIKHNWQGNIRELKTFIWRLAIDTDAEQIDYSDIELPSEEFADIIISLPTEPYNGFKLEDTLNSIRDYYYKKAFSLAGYNMSKAAGMLGVTGQAVCKWKKKNNQNA